MLFTDRSPVAVALVYQSQALHQHLRAALDEAGANVVYETATARFDASALNGSGASVVVVNLDPAIDENIEQIEDLLVDDSRKVIFNDGEVTSKLSGWDLARWARHLAAKIIGDTQMLPARPIGAEAVPVRDMPQHALDSTVKPAALQPPVVTGEAEARATREIADALSSFGVVDASASTTVQTQDELHAALKDFGFFSSDESPRSVNDMALEVAPQAAEPVPEVRTAQPAIAAAPSADEVFADFDFSELESEPVSSASGSKGVSNSDFAEIQFDFDEPPAPAANPEVSMGLDDFLAAQTAKQQEVTVELPVPAALAAPARRPAVDVDKLMSGLTLELSPIEAGESAQEPLPVAEAAASAPATGSGLASEFDDILNSLSLQPMDDGQPAVIARTAQSAASAAGAASNPFAGLSLALEPDLDADRAAESHGVESAAAQNPFASLDFALEETPDTAQVAPSPVVTPKPNAAAVSGSSAGFARVWVLGASIGGPDAVREFLSGVQRSTKNLFLLAQHMGADFLDLMVSQLAKATSLEVKMAASETVAQAGQVLVVPLAERLLLAENGDVRIVPLDEASPYSPSIDRVLFDVADRFGARSGVIIFSGMAHDAIEGAKYLASKGGVVWAQDPATCVVSSMIDGALEAGIVRYQGGAADLARKFVAEFG